MADLKASTVPKLPESLDGQIAYIGRLRTQVIQRLAVESKKVGGIPDPTVEPPKSLLPRLDTFLEALDTIKMSPILRSKSRVDEGLALMFRNDSFHFSSHHSQKARELYERWEADNWGGSANAQEVKKARLRGDDNSSESESAAEPTIKRQKTADAGFKPVPKKDRVWGLNGIMHGMARKNGNRKINILNPDYEHEKRSAARHGDNGAAVGSWYPFQLAALFKGVHGSSQAGIHYGEGDAGAYSIVVAGQYDDLDNDRGEVLYYSGSHSHDNDDPSRLPETSKGTKALHKSLETGNPVRVLRSQSGKSRYAPSRGIRYDGLYRVIAVRQKRNAKNGLYEQFELRRGPGQLGIEECRKRPNAREVRDYDLIERGY